MPDVPALTTGQPHVVIVGSGFGGLATAKALKHAPVQVTLVDRHNFHTFSPLLYQVATAGLAAEDIAPNVRGPQPDALAPITWNIATWKREK